LSTLIKAEHLYRSFDGREVIKNLSLSLDKGEIVGFLGPNGAGKTTTMRMITGFLMADRGSIEINGRNVREHPIENRADIGYLPEGAPLYPDMTPRMLLNFAGEAHGLTLEQTEKRIAELTSLIHLESVIDQQIESLSKGYKRRVAMALSIIHDPAILIMDEPTDGLDPNQKREIRALIKTMAKDKAILISTHILEEVEALCTRVILISGGEIKLDMPTKELLAKGDLEQTFYELSKGEAQ